MNKEIFSNSKVVNAFTRAQITTETTTYGAYIDTYGYNSLIVALNAVISTGEITAVVVQSSAAGSSGAADVDDDVKLLNPDQLPVDASAIIKVGAVSKLRYVRIGVTTANNGGSVSMYVDGMAFLSDAIYAPNDTNSTIDGVLEN
jgi:hypothetical protein